MRQPTTSLGGRLRRAASDLSVGEHSSRIVLPHDNPTCLCGFALWQASGKQDQNIAPFQMWAMFLEMTQ